MTQNERTYRVTVPIAGHAVIEITAKNKDEAIGLALQSIQIEHIESFGPLPRFHEGSVCYCPYPWEAEAEVVDDE